jgi:hypothetical protein
VAGACGSAHAPDPVPPSPVAPRCSDAAGPGRTGPVGRPLPGYPTAAAVYPVSVRRLRAWPPASSPTPPHSNAVAFGVAVPITRGYRGPAPPVTTPRLAHKGNKCATVAHLARTVGRMAVIFITRVSRRQACHCHRPSRFCLDTGAVCHQASTAGPLSSGHSLMDVRFLHTQERSHAAPPSASPNFTR